MLHDVFDNHDIKDAITIGKFLRTRGLQLTGVDHGLGLFHRPVIEVNPIRLKRIFELPYEMPHA